ncbi:hypothetical protein E2C01_061048 [Portunus trituberculatus]|uniref:Uncharacterized protein n=1 Tax=Portunus trituberculatus TaxID=210409 RepID=A0A5B7H9Q2_PORTR|nr:hypothetical protein [Portunus trituberculatus]
MTDDYMLSGYRTEPGRWWSTAGDHSGSRLVFLRAAEARRRSAGSVMAIPHRGATCWGLFESSGSRVARRS